jgi:hypothetical protein
MPLRTVPSSLTFALPSCPGKAALVEVEADAAAAPLQLSRTPFSTALDDEAQAHAIFSVECPKATEPSGPTATMPPRPPAVIEFISERPRDTPKGRQRLRPAAAAAGVRPPPPMLNARKASKYLIIKTRLVEGKQRDSERESKDTS